jgi:hypothetical protein
MVRGNQAKKATAKAGPSVAAEAAAADDPDSSNDSSRFVF